MTYGWRSPSEASSWGQNRPAGSGIDRHGKGIEDVPAEEPVDFAETRVMHDQRDRPDAGAGNVENRHRHLRSDHASRHAEDAHRRATGDDRPLVTGPSDRGGRDERTIRA